MGIPSSNSHDGSSTIVVGNHLPCDTSSAPPDDEVQGDKAVEGAAFQRANCATLAERLKRLQPLLDEVRESRTLVSEPGFESVEGAVGKAKELLERCSPHVSRVYMVSG